MMNPTLKQFSLKRAAARSNSLSVLVLWLLLSVPGLNAQSADGKQESGEALVRQLLESKWPVRQEVMQKFHTQSQSGPEAQASLLRAIKKSVPEMERAVRNTRGVEGEMLVLALGNIQIEPDVTVPLLAAGLDNSDWLVRRATAFALEKFGVRAQANATRLKDALASEPSNDVRWALAKALALIEPDSAPLSVTALRTILRDNSDSTFAKAHAASALAEIGPAAKEAIPELVALLENSNPDARQNALGALFELGATPAIPVLIKMLRNDADQLAAAELLGCSGPAAREALPLLESLAASAREPVRTVAVAAIARIDPDRRQAIDDLLKAVAGGPTALRAMAARAAGSLATRDPAVAKALEAALADPASQVRIQAALGLASTGLFQPTVRSIIEEALKSPVVPGRGAMMRALEKMKN